MTASTTRPCPTKTQAEIANEWDRAAELRWKQTTTGTDLTFDLVLLPTLQALVGSERRHHILDVGCGTGLLTSRLAKQAEQTIGVDLSRRSIELARRHYAAANLSFKNQSIEAFASDARQKFDLVVANMSLMTTLHLDTMLAATASVLDRNGDLVFTITHPWFWPRYWNYESATWFDYSKEIPIEAPFRISLEQDGPLTTHIHRPLQMYFEAIREAGLLTVDLREPMPDVASSGRYPADWEYPRFLAGRCILLAGHGGSQVDRPR